MSNATKTTRTRLAPDWGNLPLMTQLMAKASFDQSPGAGTTGKNLKIQGAYTITGKTGVRILNAAKADGRATVTAMGEGAEIAVLDFNRLMRDLLGAYAAGKITLPVASEKSSESSETSEESQSSEES